MEQNSNWIVTGSSVTGANHLRRDIPNQDAIDWEVKDDKLVLALSDGHGSLKYFRSDIGAQLAVESAVEVVLEEMSVDSLTTDVLSRIKARVKNKLPQRIINSWLDKVKNHYQNNLFSLDSRSQAKLEEIELEKGIKARQKLEENYVKAYGATLLLVVVAEDFSLYLQLGDGEITILSETGKRMLFTEDAKLGPATDSLCMSNPLTKFKFSLVPFAEERPLFIMLSTDGYINSFRNDNDYLQVLDDFIDLITTHGIGYLEDNLSDWLKETTEQGSGDDITLGLVCNYSVLTGENINN